MILAAILSLALAAPPAPQQACAPCSEGASIVFVLVDADQAGWEVAESSAALDAVIALSPRRWRAAVVTYSDGWARLGAPMGSDVVAVRTALNSVRSVYSIRGHAVEAARLAVAEMDKVPATPCRVMVFFGVTKDHVTSMRAELLNAAAILRRQGAPTIIGCPAIPGRWYCHGPEPEMADSARRFIVADTKGAIAAEVHNILSDTLRGQPVVECSTLTPTPTIQPTPRPPTAIPTRTPTRTPTATPTRSAIYLPFADRLECHPGRTVVDVVLVLDMSTSMLRLTSAGRSKMMAAIDAAREFVGLLGPGDRAAVAGFNGSAWTASYMSGDMAAVLDAIDGLPARAAEGTRLDLALEQAGRLVAGGRPVVILLTDGLPNRVPFPPGGSQEQTILAAAAQVKGTGARVFTIALGTDSDIDRPLMAEIASSAADAYVAVDGEVLAGIYRTIASRISGACP